jgi:hypothetical protein
VRVTVVWWDDKRTICTACSKHVDGAYQIGDTAIYICTDCIETEDYDE